MPPAPPAVAVSPRIDPDLLTPTPFPAMPLEGGKLLYEGSLAWNLALLLALGRCNRDKADAAHEDEQRTAIYGRLPGAAAPD